MTKIILICNPLFNYHISFLVFLHRDHVHPPISLCFNVRTTGILYYRSLQNIVGPHLNFHISRIYFCNEQMWISTTWHLFNKSSNENLLSNYDNKWKICDIIWYWSPLQKTTTNACRVSVFWYYNLPLQSSFDLTMIKSCDTEDSWSFW